MKARTRCSKLSKKPRSYRTSPVSRGRLLRTSGPYLCSRYANYWRPSRSRKRVASVCASPALMYAIAAELGPVLVLQQRERRCLARKRSGAGSKVRKSVAGCSHMQYQRPDCPERRCPTLSPGSSRHPQVPPGPAAGAVEHRAQTARVRPSSAESEHWLRSGWGA